MARLFNSTSDKISLNTTSTGANGSIGCWFYPTWDQNDSTEHDWYDQRSGSDAFTFTKHSDNKLYVGWIAGGVDYRVILSTGSYVINQNQWNHICFTWDDTTNASELFLNGSSVGTKSTLATTTLTGTRTIGNQAASVTNASMRIAEFAVWSQALALADVAQMARGASPFLANPRYLIDYLPLVGRDSPEPNRTSGPAGTVTGTSQAEHCRVYYSVSVASAPTPPSGGSSSQGSGTAAGAATVTGVSDARWRASGSSAGANLATGVSRARVEASGTASGSNTASGVSDARVRASGTAAGAATVTGVGRSRAESSGTAAGSSTASAPGQSRAESSGTAAGGNIATGASRARAELVGTAAGASGGAGASDAKWEAFGTAAGGNVATGYAIDGNAPPVWMKIPRTPLRGAT